MNPGAAGSEGWTSIQPPLASIQARDGVRATIVVDSAATAPEGKPSASATCRSTPVGPSEPATRTWSGVPSSVSASPTG